VKKLFVVRVSLCDAEKSQIAYFQYILPYNIIFISSRVICFSNVSEHEKYSGEQL